MAETPDGPSRNRVAWATVSNSDVSAKAFNYPVGRRWSICFGALSMPNTQRAQDLAGAASGVSQMVITQALAELYDCLPAIENEAVLAAAARMAADAVGATIVGEYEVSYIPHGLTIAVFLAESHIVLTTWPEHRLLLVDVLLCNQFMDYHLVLATIKEHVCPEGSMITHEVRRAISNSPDLS
jgi:S-adenosylmethionine decarboxylase